MRALFIILVSFKIVLSSRIYYNQNDPLWASTTQGSSTHTILSNGSLLCISASILANMGADIDGEIPTPANLNNWLAVYDHWNGEEATFPFSSFEFLGLDLNTTIDTLGLNNVSRIVSVSLQANFILIAKAIDDYYYLILSVLPNSHFLVFDPAPDPIVIMKNDSVTRLWIFKPHIDTIQVTCSPECYSSPCNCPMFPCPKANKSRLICNTYSYGIANGSLVASSVDERFLKCALDDCPCTYAELTPDGCTATPYPSSGLKLAMNYDILTGAPLTVGVAEQFLNYTPTVDVLQDAMKFRFTMTTQEHTNLNDQLMENVTSFFSNVSSALKTPSIAVYNVLMSVFWKNSAGGNFTSRRFTQLWNASTAGKWKFVYRQLERLPTLKVHYLLSYGIAPDFAEVGVNSTEAYGNIVGWIPRQLSANGHNRLLDTSEIFGNYSQNPLRIPKFAGSTLLRGLISEGTQNIDLLILLSRGSSEPQSSLLKLLNAIGSVLMELSANAPTDVYQAKFATFTSTEISYLSGEFKDLTSLTSEISSLKGSITASDTASDLALALEDIINNSQLNHTRDTLRDTRASKMILLFSNGNFSHNDSSLYKAVATLKAKNQNIILCFSDNATSTQESLLRNISTDGLLYDVTAPESQLANVIRRTSHELLYSLKTNGSHHLFLKQNVYYYFEFEFDDEGITVSAVVTQGSASNLQMYGAITFTHPNSVINEFIGVQGDNGVVISFVDPQIPELRSPPPAIQIVTSNSSDVEQPKYIYISVVATQDTSITISAQKGYKFLKPCPLQCETCDLTGTTCYTCKFGVSIENPYEDCSVFDSKVYNSNNIIFDLDGKNNDLMIAVASVMSTLFFVVIVAGINSCRKPSSNRTPAEQRNPVFSSVEEMLSHSREAEANAGVADVSSVEVSERIIRVWKDRNGDSVRGSDEAAQGSDEAAPETLDSPARATIPRITELVRLRQTSTAGSLVLRKRSSQEDSERDMLGSHRNREGPTEFEEVLNTRVISQRNMVEPLRRQPTADSDSVTRHPASLTLDDEGKLKPKKKFSAVRVVSHLRFRQDSPHKRASTPP